jgi:Tfp pilus assembly protein PilF
MQGKYSQALSNYKKVLALEPNNYIVMNNISSMLIYLRSYEEAIRYAQKALNVKKDYPSPLINIGIGYGYLGKVSESERYFERALAIEPSNHNALLNLGILYEKQNSLNKADGYYIKLSDTGDVQGYLGRARIAEKQKRMADAIYYYRLVVSLDAGDSQVSNTARERLLQLAK